MNSCYKAHWKEPKDERYLRTQESKLKGKYAVEREGINVPQAYFALFRKEAKHFCTNFLWTHIFRCNKTGKNC